MATTQQTQQAVAEEGTEGAAKLRVSQEIATRDGTLTKDSKLVNCYMDPSVNGPSVVKRAGTALYKQLPAGVGQNLFRCNDKSYAIVGDVIYLIPDGTAHTIPSVTTAGQPYTILSNAPYGKSLLKSPSGLWVFDGTTATKVTDSNYPAATVPGIVYLDGTYYVMNTVGEVYGSKLEDPTVWPALQFIKADAPLGTGVGIIRHLNYLVAFYTAGVQFYYDAGNSPGIPLGIVGNASWLTGSASGYTIVEMWDTTIFVGQGKHHGRNVQLLSGLSKTIVSTPAVERVLNRATLANGTVFCYLVKVGGHSFYVLTMTDINVTLVYDLLLNKWHLWSSVVGGVEQCFAGFYCLGIDNFNLLLDKSTGTVYSLSLDAYTDVTGPINVLIRTSPKDWGTMNWKRIAAMYLHADTSPSTIGIRYSDDDYQTFSAYRYVDLNSVRKMLQRCGRSRRRSWDLLHTANTAFRIYGVQLDMGVAPA